MCRCALIVVCCLLFAFVRCVYSLCVVCCLLLVVDVRALVVARCYSLFVGCGLLWMCVLFVVSCCLLVVACVLSLLTFVVVVC